MSRAKISAIGLASATAGASGALLYHSYSDGSKSKTVAAVPPAPGISTKALPVQASAPLQIFPASSELVSLNHNGILKYGSPGPVLDELKSLALWGAYDRRTRNPWWVAEHITSESVARSDAKRNNGAFSEDKTIPLAFRARMKDYSHSGYDRGHQVPAANAGWSQKAMDDTFKLTNMCPQVGEGFNRHYWSRLENFCRNLTQKYPSVRIVTGPLYLPKKDDDGKWRVSYEVIGDPPNVSVPTHFFKIIFAENEDTTNEDTNKVAVGAFVLPNASIDNKKLLADFEVDLEIVERASGLQFAGELALERRKRLCREVKCDVSVRNFREASAKPKL
ncbi:unnamed protein product [Penicillium salamii]|nr:unnamed protein product [Penicillium salamii]